MRSGEYGGAQAAVERWRWVFAIGFAVAALEAQQPESWWKKARVRMNGEARVRGGAQGWRENARLTVTGDPGPRTRFSAMFRDARGGRGESARDRHDVGHAWIEYGAAEGPGWRVRAGRQELSFGDERLIGGDSEWCNLGVVFDALHVEWRSERARVDWFAAAPVQTIYTGWNGGSRGAPLHGVYGSWRAAPQTWIDPYLLRRGGRDTAGVHLKSAQAGFRQNVEWSAQRGAGPGAWAGHFEAGRDVIAGLSAAFEFNHASPWFDDLFAAAHNRYGTADPFRARDLGSVEAGATWTARRNLEIRSGYRRFWRVAQPGRLADQIHLAALYRHSERWRFAAGIGRLLRPTGLLAPGETPALSAYGMAARTF